MHCRPRPLVLVDRFPLPAVSGGRQRMWNYLRAIDLLGPADLVVLATPGAGEVELLVDGLPGWTVQTIPINPRPVATVRRVGAMLRASAPSNLVVTDVVGAAASVADLVRRPRPVIAVQGAAAMVALQLGGACSPLVIDLWDVEPVRIRREMAAAGPVALTPQSLWHLLRRRSDVRAWQRLLRHMSHSAAAITVCSGVDRVAMPEPENVWVVPNGADVPSKPTPRRADPRVVLLHGQHTYTPNADAARVLAEEVEPLVRAQVPDVQVRIVGSADERVRRLHRPPGVTVTGLVADVHSEIDQASVLVVPLRVGGGTRLKILEAFARRLPVVSTKVGVEGLDVQHRKHLLIADDPAGIARCTVELIGDTDLAKSLADNAFELVRSSYDWGVIRASFAERLGSLLLQEPGCTGGPATTSDPS